MKAPCEICEEMRFLVRDHDHATGYIRGLLCDFCNWHLGLYEANRRDDTTRGNGRFRRWVDRYRERIDAHLEKNTGVLYQQAPRRKHRRRGTRNVAPKAIRRNQQRHEKQLRHVFSALDVERQEGLRRYRECVPEVPRDSKAGRKR